MNIGWKLTDKKSKFIHPPWLVGFGLIEMTISTNPKPTIYRSLYENTGPRVS